MSSLPIAINPAAFKLRRPLVRRIERLLRSKYGAWSSALTSLVLAAIAGRSEVSVHVRVIARRSSTVDDFYAALQSLLPAGWIDVERRDRNGNPVQPPEECRLFVRTAEDVVAATIEHRNIECSSLATIVCEDAPDPEQGWLDIMLDEGNEQMKWRANRVRRRWTAAGRILDLRIERGLTWICNELQQIDLDADVVFDGSFELPEFPSTPVHMPEQLNTLYSLGRAWAVLDNTPTVYADYSLLCKTIALLNRAGVIDQPSDVGRANLDFLVWFDVLAAGRGPMSIDDITKGLSNPTFRQELVTLLQSTGIGVYPANKVWNYHAAYRALLRLKEVGAVLCDDSNKKHLWSISPAFRGYRPGNLFAQLARK